MIEVEMKIKVNDKVKIEEKLLQHGFELGDMVSESDLYYDNTAHEMRINDKALRIRSCENLTAGSRESYLTFKGPKLDQISMTRKEVEIKIDDENSGKEFLKALGYQLIAPVRKTRQYLYKGEITACIDQVENLGDFLELEIVTTEEERETALDTLVKLLNQLGYEAGETICTSYLSMLQKQAMVIRKATREDYPDVREFYYELTDTLQDAQYSPGWERDIYPTQEWLIESIEKQELYLGELNGRIVSCMVVNQEYNDGYKGIDWIIEAKDSELLVIHALGVAANVSGRGLAKQMVGYVIEMAKSQGIKTIRLDVLEGNLPAEKSYTKVGFEYTGTVPMFYEDTGWTNYKAFEYVV